MQRADNSLSVPSLPPSLTFFLSFFLLRCNDNISEQLLALTTVGVEPLRTSEPFSKGILFIHCNASSHRKWENRGSELAIPQKGAPLLRTMALTAEPVIQWESDKVQTERDGRKGQRDKRGERQRQRPSTICMRVQEAERSKRQLNDLKSS